MIDLSVEFAGLKLKNPVMSGSGPQTHNLGSIKAAVDAGCGALVSKTATYFATPYYWQYSRPYFQLIGWEVRPDEPFYKQKNWQFYHKTHPASYPPENYAKIITQAAKYCAKNDCVLMGNISGVTIDKWCRLGGVFVKAGCKAIELNFSGPPSFLIVSESDQPQLTEKKGVDYLLNPKLGVEVVKAVKEAVDVPVFVKVGAFAGAAILPAVKAFEKAGVDGITCMANQEGLRIDIETAKPLMDGLGPAYGVTGCGVKPFSLWFVSWIARETKLPVMGARGAMDGRDAIEFMMAGANAVQYCTAIIVNGYDYVKTVLNEIKQFMERRGYSNTGEFKGAALSNLFIGEERERRGRPLLALGDLSKCTGCGRCEKVCWFGAIRVPKRGLVKISKQYCVGCTLCKQVCPTGAISMLQRESEEDYLKALTAHHPELRSKEIFKLN